MRSSPSFTHLFILSSKTLIQTVYVLYVFIGPVFLNFRHLLVSFLSSLKGFFRSLLNCILQAVLSHHVYAGNHWAIPSACWPLLLSFSLSIPNLIRTFIRKAYHRFFCTRRYHVISVLYLYGLLTLLLCIGWTGIGSLEWNLLFCDVWSSLCVLEFSFEIFCDKFCFHVHQGN